MASAALAVTENPTDVPAGPRNGETVMVTSRFVVEADTVRRPPPERVVAVRGARVVVVVPGATVTVDVDVDEDVAVDVVVDVPGGPLAAVWLVPPQPDAVTHNSAAATPTIFLGAITVSMVTRHCRARWQASTAAVNASLNPIFRSHHYPTRPPANHPFPR